MAPSSVTVTAFVDGKGGQGGVALTQPPDASYQSLASALRGRLFKGTPYECPAKPVRLFVLPSRHLLRPDPDAIEVPTIEAVLRGEPGYPVVTLVAVPGDAALSPDPFGIAAWPTSKNDGGDGDAILEIPEGPPPLPYIGNMLCLRYPHKVPFYNIAELFPKVSPSAHARTSGTARAIPFPHSSIARISSPSFPFPYFRFYR